MSPFNIPPNRRQFLKYLAGSPLLAALYPALPDGVKQLVTQRAHAQTAPTETQTCPGCGQPFIPDPGFYGRGAVPPEYEYSLINSVDEAINVWDFEKVLHANNLPQHWNYLRGGVDDDATIIANRLGYQRLQILNHRLDRDVQQPVDKSIQLFGRKWERPLFICPVGSLMAYHTEAELAVGRAAKAKNALMIESTVSSYGYEEIAEQRGEPHWFQLYADRDWAKTSAMLKRVESAGCPTVVWTIDLLGGSNRETLRRSQGLDEFDQPLCQECHNHAPDYVKPMGRNLENLKGERTPFTWDYVKRLKDATSMNVVLKGIVTEHDAAEAVAAGADAVYVSNHGGRAEESYRSTIEALPEVVRGAGGRIPVLIDSGVRRGTDIFKALALGATAVGIGRPYVWGLGAFGQEGVEKVIEILDAELDIVMRQATTMSRDEINPTFVHDRYATAITKALSQR